MKKRISAALLALVMALSLLPTAALAKGEQKPKDPTVTVQYGQYVNKNFEKLSGVTQDAKYQATGEWNKSVTFDIPSIDGYEYLKCQYKYGNNDYTWHDITSSNQYGISGGSIKDGKLTLWNIWDNVTVRLVYQKTYTVTVKYVDESGNDIGTGNGKPATATRGTGRDDKNYYVDDISIEGYELVQGTRENPNPTVSGQWNDKDADAKIQYNYQAQKSYLKISEVKRNATVTLKYQKDYTKGITLNFVKENNLYLNEMKVRVVDGDGNTLSLDGISSIVDNKLTFSENLISSIDDTIKNKLGETINVNGTTYTYNRSYFQWYDNKVTVTSIKNEGSKSNEYNYNSYLGYEVVNGTSYRDDGWKGDWNSWGNKNEDYMFAYNPEGTLYIVYTEPETPTPTTYTVTFDSDGGSPAPDAQTVVENDKATAPSDVTKTGYTLDGWYKTNDDGTLEATAWNFDTDTVTSNMTLKAKWTPKTYTVTFNGNGGTPSKDSMTVTYGSAYGALATATRDDYTFKGWFTDSEGGTEVKAGDTVTITADQDLYAHWDPITYKYKLAYSWTNAPSGQELPSNEEEYDSSNAAHNAVDTTFTSSTTVDGTSDGKNGVWKFSGWTCTSVDTGADNVKTLTFEGTWSFKEATVGPDAPIVTTGSLTIKKVVEKEGTLTCTPPTKFKFAVVPDGVTMDWTTVPNNVTIVEIEVGNDGKGEKTVNGLEVGSYTVCEDPNVSNCLDNTSDSFGRKFALGSETCDDEFAKVTISTDSTPVVTVTNTYTAGTGDEKPAPEEGTNVYVYAKTVNSAGAEQHFGKIEDLTLKYSNEENGVWATLGKLTGIESNSLNKDAVVTALGTKFTAWKNNTGFDLSVVTWDELKQHNQGAADYFYEEGDSGYGVYNVWVLNGTVQVKRLTYDANCPTGVSGEPAGVVKYYAKGSATVATNSFTAPTGYTFTGWNTAANGTGTNYAADADIPLTGDVTLYAQWQKNTPTAPTTTDVYVYFYTVNTDGEDVKAEGITYNGNDWANHNWANLGKLTTTTPVSNTTTGLGDQVTSTNDSFEWFKSQGSILNGISLSDVTWNTTPTQANGAPGYLDAGVWTWHLDGKLTVYRVIYELEGGSWPEGTTDPNTNPTYYYGTDYMGAPSSVGVTVEDNPFRKGYEFIGWSEKPNGSTLADGTVSFTDSNITVYAQWEKLPTGTLTVTKKLAGNYPSNAEFKFNIYAVNDDGSVGTTAYKTVTVKGGSSAEVELPVGTYKVEEAAQTFSNYTFTTKYEKSEPEPEVAVLSQDSIEVDPNQQMVTVCSGKTSTVTVTNTFTYTGPTYTYDDDDDDDDVSFNRDDHLAYIQGYDDGTFRPTANITRGAVSAILYRIMDPADQKKYGSTVCSYSDVNADTWCNLYVATLEKAGVIRDTETGGAFRPYDAITRAELVVMLARFAHVTDTEALEFKDVDTTHWAAKEIQIAAELGWIKGYEDGTFQPDAPITRAALVTMINRALGRVPAKAANIITKKAVTFTDCAVGDWCYIAVQEAANSHEYYKIGSNGNEKWTSLLKTTVK